MTVELTEFESKNLTVLDLSDILESFPEKGIINMTYRDQSVRIIEIIRDRANVEIILEKD